MPSLKPIETVYKGYRFRSRLEARWAVFFDVLGWQWEYEKEGYDLGPAGWYLPDFWVLPAGRWIEIRPVDQFFYDARCQALAVASSTVVHYIAGNPYPGEYRSCFYYADNTCSGSESLFFENTEQIKRAFTAARSARFEHGQSGAGP